MPNKHNEIYSSVGFDILEKNTGIVPLESMGERMEDKEVNSEILCK